MGINPIAIAITPGAASAYVANEGDNTVTPIDTANNTPGTPIQVGSSPDAIAITPDGSTAYVANSGVGTVTPINTATNVAGSPITVGSSPDAIAITPDGSTAYVANYNDNTVTPIDTATDTPALPIPVGDGPSAIAITPNGPTAYVANFLDGTVTPIDTTTNTAGTPIPVGNYPSAVAITPDGSIAYVANEGDNTVTPIDTATGTPGTPIQVGNSPDAIAITPDGSTAYVANSGDGDVTPIDTATDTAGTTIPVGNSPGAVAISYVPVRPTVTGVAPDNGSTAGGTALIITGTGFMGATAADIGGSDTCASEFAVVNATEITCTTPPGAGTVDVTMTTSQATSAVNAPGDRFTYEDAPTVTGVAPDNGSTAGGTPITITGTGFIGATVADIGGSNACTTDFTVVSATSITCDTPAGPAGTVNVTVTTPQGTSAANPPDDDFTYEDAPTVTGVAPDNGSTAGGTPITITGTGFIGATVADIGGSNACTTDFTVVSATSITCDTPAGPAGTVNVTVTTPQGTSAANPPDDDFTYEDAPTVTGVAPDNGSTAGGTPITITGTGFIGATVADIGGSNACTTDFTVVSATSITCDTPAGPAGTVNVTVTTPQGTSAANPPDDDFTYVTPPPTRLVFTTSPTKSVAGSALATQPQVTVEDASGNPVTTNASTVTLSITPLTPTSGGPGALTGCAQSGETNGVASFTGCEIDTAGTGYELRATDGRLTAADSSPFTVSAGPATHFSVTAPATATAGPRSTSPSPLSTPTPTPPPATSAP